MTKKSTFSVGDKVVAYLKYSANKKLKVKGEIKKIDKHFGLETYTITNGVTDDFPTRIIEK